MALQDAAHFALRLLDVVETRVAPLARGATPGCCTCSSASTSRWCPPCSTATVSTTGTPSSCSSRARSSPESAAAREVAHVERDDHRHAEVAQFERQPQVEPQVRRVDDAHHELRRRLAGQPAEQEVARDRLVERGRRQAVGAGQVEDPVLAPSRDGPTNEPSLRSTVTPA